MLTSMKPCTKCGETDEGSFFKRKLPSGRISRRSICKRCHTLQVEERRKLIGYHNIWYEKNKQAHKNKLKKYRKKRPEAIKRYLSKAHVRLRNNLRGRIQGALKNNRKSKSTIELIGCTIPELRKHLESKFKSGMTWDNYGKYWHVDHIKPCSLFNLSDPNEQKKCFHYSNMQPLEAWENLRKSNKYEVI